MIDIHLTHWPFIRWRRERAPARTIGWMGLIGTIAAGSTYNSFAKPLTEALTPFTLLFISELLTALFVLLSFGIVPLIKQALGLSRRSVIFILLVGVLSSIVAPCLWFRGLQTTSAVNASLFGSIDALFLVILAIILLRERWSRAHIYAALSITVGIAVITLRGFETGVEVRSGDVFILAAAFIYSVGAIIFRRFLHRTEPQIVILIRSSVAVCAFLAFGAFFPQPVAAEILALPRSLIVSLIGFAFIARFLNLFSYYVAIDRIPVSTVSIVSSLSIVTGPLFAHVYLGEALQWYHLWGGLFIVLGTLFLEVLGMHPTAEHLEKHLVQRFHHRP
ncbi:MAG: hypothetical protein Greene041619_1168 [Candidatus Peregrinibacteria bacterium Greene0416_19]|nr:MAG: hypothetical protein Greene041619_1168 [Candidatus Peregrinibacteria bacterium Greene0416_19]